jgi:hypothetical protein
MMKKMKFGKALERCKQGRRIARSGWNGKDQFVFYSPGFVVLVEYLTNEILKAWAHERGLTQIEFWGHLDFKPSNNKIQCGWFPTQSDMQAEDWYVV